jgi:hypothetical protein
VELGLDVELGLLQQVELGLLLSVTRFKNVLIAS